MSRIKFGRRVGAKIRLDMVPTHAWKVFLACFAFAAAAAQASDLAPERRAQLRHLVLQDCGSCHGMRMTGGLGPALTPQALRERDPNSMIVTILAGRPGTAMPPWRPFLTENEAAWILEQLLKGEIRAR